MRRESGILLPITSLPSPYGIGCFSREAYEFIDYLKKAGQSYWQILPLGPTSYGDSPYQSFSTFAGNPYFIDLETLVEEGLLTAEECDEADFGENPEKIAYDKIYERMYRNRRQSVNRYEYPFKDNKQPLPPNKLKVLLEMLPEAAYDAKIYQTYVNVGKKTKVKTTKDGRTLRYISRPEGFKLELIRRVLPDFYDTIKRERTLDNCEIDDIVITWMTPTDCDVYAVVSDNDSAHYDLDWVEDRRFCDKD